MTPTRLLVVASRTARCDALLDELEVWRAKGAGLYLLVPVEIPPNHLTWSETEVWQVAEQRLNDALAAWRARGLEATGRVCNGRPIDGIVDAVRDWSIDHVVVSTLPIAISRWFGMGLPDQVRSTTGLPVTHIVAADADVTQGPSETTNVSAAGT
jgi:hypothetical protein